ncbi:MAG: hypothetical protein D6690_11265 [Nitrospirae bacterium]|nr:MAG: hypothetical protein D6690_11265 [Nitrospirota bacterium]
MRASGWSVLGAGLVVPWCCLAPAGLSLVGVSGLSLNVLGRLEAELFPYLAMAATLLIGYAHYLIALKRQGNMFSRIVTWASTGLVAT